MVGYTYKRAITVSNPGSTNLLDCQVRIDLHRLNFDFTRAQSDGRDLRITATDGVTLLSYWYENYDATKKTALIWVKMPSVSVATSITLWLWYGNAGATAVSSYSSTMLKTPATDANTLASYDFAAGSGTTVADAMGTYNLTLAGSPTWGAVDGGAFGGGLLSNTFSGSFLTLDGTTNQTITSSTLLNTVPSVLSISFWFKPTTSYPAGVLNKRIISKVNSLSSDNFIEAYIDSANGTPKEVGKLVVSKSNGGVNKIIKSRRKRWKNDKWYYITITCGSGGFSLWVDGIQEALDLTTTTTFGNGTLDVFRLGGGYTNTNNMNAAFYGLLVESRVPGRDEILARFQRTKYYPMPNTQFAKLKKHPANPVVTAVAGRAYIGEVSIYMNGNTMEGYFASVNSDATISEGYRKTSTDGINWSTGQVVLGNGVGGETGKVSRNSIYVESGTYYLYYCLLNDLKIYVATSPDGITFTKQAGAILSFVSPFISVDNTCVVKTGPSSYVMLVDGYNNAVLDYQLSLATASSPLGPFTFAGGSQAANVQTTLEFARDNSAGFAPFLQPAANGGWHLWYHNKNPGHLYYAYTADSTLLSNSWQNSPNNPILIITPTLNSNTDQATDLSMVQMNGKSYAVYSTADNTLNPPVYVNCDMASFPGTIAELVNELTVIIGSEQTVGITRLLASAGVLIKSGGNLTTYTQ